MLVNIYKIMLLVSSIMVLFSLGGEGMLSSSALAHSSPIIIVPVLFSTLVFYILIFFQIVIGALSFTRYRTAIPLSIVFKVILFQLFHLGMLFFHEAFNDHFMNILLSIMDIIFFVLLVIYGFKFFLSEKAKDS